MSLRKGFTLIELLIVLSVLAILGTLGLAALVNYSRQQTLKTASRDLRTNLRLTQNKAITQEKPADGSCNRLVGYKLAFSADGTRYIIYRICSGIVDTNIREFSLPSDIAKTGADEVIFNAGVGSATNQITFTLTGYGSTENITVTTTGVIQ